MLLVPFILKFGENPDPVPRHQGAAVVCWNRGAHINLSHRNIAGFGLPIKDMWRISLFVAADHPCAPLRFTSMTRGNPHSGNTSQSRALRLMTSDKTTRSRLGTIPNRWCWRVFQPPGLETMSNAWATLGLSSLRKALSAFLNPDSGCRSKMMMHSPG